MIELLLEVVGELALQVLVEISVEFGSQALVKTHSREARPFWAALGYGCVGATLGALSLAFFPSHLTPPGVVRLLNLAFTPLAVGGFMVVLGAWRARRGEDLVRLDKFSYGYLFALSFALVRFFFAR